MTQSFCLSLRANKRERPNNRVLLINTAVERCDCHVTVLTVSCFAVGADCLNEILRAKCVCFLALEKQALERQKVQIDVTSHVFGTANIIYFHTRLARFPCTLVVVAMVTDELNILKWHIIDVKECLQIELKESA